ncbi:MAG: AraC family transcriptional regulator [Rariglobus sp.]|jgi:AraC-like DNA-binding protein|nr:AraC family transcriptional regulator [Rariglobus sp.]
MPDEVFPTVINTDEEERTSPSYAYDNRRRNGSDYHVAIQRTLRGRAWFRDDRGTHDVPAGHAMLFTHAEPTAYGYPKDATEPYALRYISVTIGGLGPLFTRLRQDFGSVVRMPDDSEATALFDELHGHFKQRTFSDRLQESELIHRLLIALYREQVQGTRTSDPIEFGHHYLRSHFRSPINLKLVAEKCAVSREHFIREFTRRYHESPGALLRRLRLEQARAMLAATDTDVESIALASGYASSNTFCRAYRQKFGRSPRALSPSEK